MDRFKNILVAAGIGRLDADTLKASVAFAAKNGAALTVLDVLEPLPAWRRTVNVEGRSVNVEQLMLRDRSERLRDLVGTTGGGQAVVETRTGKPLLEVIRYVLSQECDLVIVGETETARGARGLSADVMQLLRKCPVPVWVTRPVRSATLRILALVDPVPSDPARDGLNDLVLQLATSMTRREEAELHVAHAWNLPGEASLRASSFVSVPGNELDIILSATEEEHHARLVELIRRHGIEEVGGRVHLVKGDAGTALPELAKNIAATLIIMGTVARTGLSGLIMGNTAETVLRGVTCSVLALKPKGFVSPVRAEDGERDR